MTGIIAKLKGLLQEMRAASNEQHRLVDSYDEELFEERKARHDAGIFERPSNTGGA